MTKLRECLKDRCGNYLYPFFWQVGADDEALIEEIRAIDECGTFSVGLGRRYRHQEVPRQENVVYDRGSCGYRGTPQGRRGAL